MDSQNLSLVAVETSQIQAYIFNSNRLKENIGASYLVALATGEWALESVTIATKKHNVLVENPYQIADHEIDKEDLEAEVLYSGGGNFVSLFRTANVAKAFIRHLSRRVLLEAPGLALSFVEKEGGFDWENQVLSVEVAKLLRSFRKTRSEQPLQRGLMGLGVTMMCNSSSLPANYFELDPDDLQDDPQKKKWKVYSAEVKSKRDFAADANIYLRKLLEIDKIAFKKNPSLSYKNFVFSNELDELGRSKGDSSFMAVVHADGNGLGLLIQGLKDNPLFNQPREGNRAYIRYMRNFSEKVKEVNQEAQASMFKRLAQSITINDGEAVIVGFGKEGAIQKNQVIRLGKDKATGKWILPIRPLVSGGDDITFVCDGRIGIGLAIEFLKSFEAATKKILKIELSTIGLEKLTACAGVAVVKSHYPFSRAYDLADELAGSAKQLVNEDSLALGLKTARYSAIDWHFTTEGIYDDLDAMREREYQVMLYDADIEKELTGFLNLRPIFVDKDAHTYRNWLVLEGMITEFQRKWCDNRSKAKGLMDALRQGDVEVEVFKLRYLSGTDLSLPAVASFDKHFGWLEKDRFPDPESDKEMQCGYYDALELLDLYLPLTTEA